MRVAEEIVGVDDFGGLIERRVVDQDRAQHTLFGLEIVWQDAFSHGGCNYN